MVLYRTTEEKTKTCFLNSDSFLKADRFRPDVAFLLEALQCDGSSASLAVHLLFLLTMDWEEAVKTRERRDLRYQ